MIEVKDIKYGKMIFKKRLQKRLRKYLNRTINIRKIFFWILTPFIFFCTKTETFEPIKNIKIGLSKEEVHKEISIAKTIGGKGKEPKAHLNIGWEVLNYRISKYDAKLVRK